MSALGNILWFIFGGFKLGMVYIIAGLSLCITIIGLPFGIKAIQMGVMVMFPFGKEVIHKPGGDGCVPMAFNIGWLLVFGWGLALAHIFVGIALGITIVGIPFAKQHFKFVSMAILPFTYELL